MSDYPVQLEVTPPVRFDRLQLLVRLVLAVMLGWVGLSAGRVGTVLYIGLPIFAAIVISTRGADSLLSNAGPRLWRVIEWLLAFSAYMLLVTDRFPTGRDPNVQVQLGAAARPRVGSALLRLITGIPHAILLSILSLVSWVLVLVSFVTVLFNRSVPEAIQGFQTGFVRWEARLLAYLTSLVDEYPPFSLDAHRAIPRAQASAV